MFINKLAYDIPDGFVCSKSLRFYKDYEEPRCNSCTVCQDLGKYHYQDCTPNTDTICEDTYTLLYVTGNNLNGELGETSNTSPIQLANFKKKFSKFLFAIILRCF